MSDGPGILVLHASGNELRLVRTRLVRDRVELSNACAFLSGERGRDASALRDETTLDAFFEYVTRQGWIGQDFVCMVGGSSVACYYYDMPPLRGDALRQAVLLKLGQQLHFDVAEAVVAVEALTPHGSDKTERIRVSATAVHQDLASAAINAAARAGLDVKAVSAAPAAVAALAQDASNAKHGLQAFLHVDERLSTLVVLEGSSPSVTSELPIGMADLTKALMRPIVSGEDVIQLDEARATALRNEVGIPKAGQKIESLSVTGDRLLPLLEPVLQQFTKQLTQWLTFASTTVDGGTIKSLGIVGPGAAVDGLAETIASRLSIDVHSKHWLKELAVLTGASEGLALDSFATAVGAAQHWQALPDLIPAAFRKERRNRRISKAVTIFGTAVAATIVAFAFLFDQVGDRLFPYVTTHQEQLTGVQQLVGVNEQWALQQKTVARLQRQLDDFSRSSPSWVGIFKEIAVLLPREVQASEFVAQPHEDGIRLVLNGTVYHCAHGRSFDEAVEQSLLLLQRSSFFKRIQLLTASRGPRPDNPDVAGTLAIELDLVYPRPTV